VPGGPIMRTPWGCVRRGAGTGAVLQELDDFAELFLGLVDAGDVLERHLVASSMRRSSLPRLLLAGESACSLLQEQGRMRPRPQQGDVQGRRRIDEAKEELSEIVEFLKDPRRFQRLGGRIPKGVLMIGLPHRQDLLAKAIAGEADVPSSASAAPIS